jgi:hypothetical protein
MTEDTGFAEDAAPEPEPEDPHAALRRLIGDAAHEAPVTAQVLSQIVDLLP